MRKPADQDNKGHSLILTKYILIPLFSLFFSFPSSTLHSDYLPCCSACCLSLSHVICLLLSYTVLSSLFPLAIPRPVVQPVGLNKPDKRWKIDRKNYKEIENEGWENESSFTPPHSSPPPFTMANSSQRPLFHISLACS